MIPIALVSLMLAPAPAAEFEHPAAEIAAAELAFAAQSVAMGMNTAFATHLAEDAVVFQPLPQTNGRALYAARENPPLTLDWYPALTLAAASGDFGLSTGPFTLVSRTDPARRSHGHFISIWQRQQGGQWKVLIDGGIAHSRPVFEIPRLDPADMPVNQLSERFAGTKDVLRTAEVGLLQSAEAQGLVAAFRSWTAPQLRLYLEGQLPVIGQEAALEALRDSAAEWRWQMMDGRIAASGDLGFTYGLLLAPDASSEPPLGTFLHVWQRTGSEWKLIIAREALFP